MKVVLLHDWLTGFRGGERVLEAFCEMFPDAPVYTLFYKKNSVSPLVENRSIHTSFLQKMPCIHRQYRKLLPFFPWGAGSLKLEKADLVLSSSHCVIKGTPKPRGSLHICFIHSPMRYLYDQYDAYFKDAPFYERMGAALFKNHLSRWDLKSNANVDFFIANSQFVADRVLKYYGVSPRVVHPFVELADFKEIQKNPPQKEDFFLAAGAFSPNKRIDLAIMACNEMRVNLKIIGRGQREKQLRRRAGGTIEFLGHLPRSELISYLAKAQALIFPGVEDFGIIPLEALAAGTPVIAYKRGGVCETLDEKVAQFFHDPTSTSLKEAMTRFEKKTFKREKLLARAAGFSRELFKRKMTEVVHEYTNRH